MESRWPRGLTATPGSLLLWGRGGAKHRRLPAKMDSWEHIWGLSSEEGLLCIHLQLHLQTCSRGRWRQVVVHGLKGRDTVVDVATSEEAFKQTTVKQLMVLVSEKMLHKESEEFTLLFASERLDPAKTLQDYSIRNKSCLLIIVQLPGGAGEPGSSEPLALWCLDGAGQ
nr:uncharacterized protein LOC111748321 isoform X2 [Loxodonta africana]